MALSKDDVHKIAGLARLHLDDAQTKRMQGEINPILDWVAKLDEVDTKDLQPLTSVSGERLHWRDDIINDGGDVSAVLQNAPDPITLDEGGFFSVPKVVE